MPKQRVVIIGAAGYVAQQILPVFRERYDLVLIDVSNVTRDGTKIEDVIVEDMLSGESSEYEDLFSGTEAVLHLGRKRREGDPIDHFRIENANVQMNYNVFRTAFEAGVSRVVYASSNHAADWYEQARIHDRKMENLDPYTLPLSHSFYGWAKASTENMGFLFACGAFGRRLEVVNVRIGTPAEVDYPRTQDIRSFKRHLGSYISPRDMAQLLIKAIETPDINNEDGVPWQIVYGISDNTRAYWSLISARDVLGYSPDDDAEVKFSEQINRHLAKFPGAEGRVGILKDEV